MSKVSIITRTKNRPLMLTRALQSVSNQEFKDMTWVIVNDGGDCEPVESIVNEAKSKNLPVRVVHHKKSLGMEAASNAGICAAQSEFVVIHDDDDSWHPDFLLNAVEYMEALPSNSNIKGVITRSFKVVEVVKKDQIHVTQRKPYDPYLQAVTLVNMARLHNVPPPISFVYRREVFNQIGMYREDLPVLGDWEFNLRFLRQYDIGVITKYLANYHWRQTQNTGLYGNSIIANNDLHARTAAKIKNELLRDDLAKGKIGLGHLVNFCSEFQELHNKVKYTAFFSDLLYKNFVFPMVKLYRTFRDL